MATPDDAALARLAQRLAARLLADGRRLATAESCTGGYIAKVLTDLPGSSQWFDSGYVTYSNAAKQRDLGVPARVLEAHGAVSGEVVIAMARGALRATGAHVAVAVSGIAGPAGAMPGKPVGTVWIAWAWREGFTVSVETRCCHFRGGDRDTVRRRTVQAALQGLLKA
ncbi:MAG: CinA family protein [Steroidobacteraceae bacterium]|nr:CinA family protein [Steroidobacteraceae bacterium]